MRLYVTKFLLVLFVAFLCLDGYFLMKYLSSRNINKNQSVGFFKEKPGKCLILEEKYCSNYEIIKNPMNEEDLLIAFKLPKNTPLFAPVDGGCSISMFNLKTPNNNETKQYQGLTVFESTKNPKTTIIRNSSINKLYHFIFFNSYNNNCSNKKRGEIIGVIDDKNISFYGNYNLVFNITKQFFSGQKYTFENANEDLKKIFN